MLSQDGQIVGDVDRLSHRSEFAGYAGDRFQRGSQTARHIGSAAAVTGLSHCRKLTRQHGADHAEMVQNRIALSGGLLCKLGKLGRAAQIASLHFGGDVVLPVTPDRIAIDAELLPQRIEAGAASAQ
jgi:hypothetical protein